MLRGIAKGIHWNARLGVKFLWAAPGATSAVVFFTLVSQLSMLLAFFLPLKVLILLGSDRIPRYFPPAFEQFDRDALIVWLSAATVAFYVLYLVAERVITFGADRGARTLLARSRKMVLFENQDEIAARAYKNHSEVIAGAVFLILVMIVLVWLYPSVAWLVGSFVTLVGVSLLTTQAVSSGFRTAMQENLTAWLSVFAGVGFMLAFAYLVIDFLYLDPPGLIPAIIALLLSRQGFNRLSGLVSGMVKQRSQRAKIDALFFHTTAFVPEQETHKETIWGLLASEQREKWVPVMLAEIFGEPMPPGVELEWWQTDIPNVAVLRCHVPDSPSFFIKLFAHNRSAAALHEATLLADPPKGLPCLRWVGSTIVRGFHCHVLQALEELLDKPGATSEDTQKLRKALLEVQPPDSLVTRYRRSRQMLWQRLDLSMLERLQVAVTDANTQESLEALRLQLNRWRNRLADLPLAFTTRDIRPANLVVTKGGSALLLHWGRWDIEPAGASWPTGPNQLEELFQACDVAPESRRDLMDCEASDLVLAALSFEFERLFLRQQYTQALQLIPGIVGRLARVGPASESQEKYA